MPDAHTVLAQILRMVPRMEFEKLAREHGGENRVRSFPCWSQFACLVYAQLSRQTSLRDLVLALETKRPLLYHPDSKLHFQDVVLGRDFGDTIDVQDGLQGNEPIVKQPLVSLQEGQLVTPIEARKPRGG